MGFIFAYLCVRNAIKVHLEAIFGVQFKDYEAKSSEINTFKVYVYKLYIKKKYIILFLLFFDVLLWNSLENYIDAYVKDFYTKHS